MITLLLALLCPAPHTPQAPQGWLDCEFDKHNVYRCKP